MSWSNCLYKEPDIEVTANLDVIPEMNTTQLAEISLTSLTTTSIYLPQRPSNFRVRVSTLQTDYGAVDFLPALTRFLQKHLPHIKTKPNENDVFNVYKRIRLAYPALQGFGNSRESDTICASPTQLPSQAGKSRTPAYFDTAIISETEKAELMGMEGATVAQVRVIFKLSPGFGEYTCPLAYVEYFKIR
ncbi:hypothetical protein Clacol_007985 [Clathrus columnatus]|uniref:Uncharacterized protein n=1 Tax=Clathrus columnatus TaxID=1419009 RepID=A0AAV5AKR8_9AGAM|nr:hypothetical protein Clacol_007985 [Clathrus columnatus]